ncbi:MAG: DEAD/DEAH box helicase [Myxococcaceae bacterium]
MRMLSDSLDAALVTSEVEVEARDVLRERAHRQTGKVPADTVVTHVMKITAGGDFPLRTSALDSVLRRIKSAREESRGWRQGGPTQRGALGLRQVNAGSGKVYRVQVRSFAALEGSCECADFGRNSLGLCKHLWWVLEQGFDSRGRCVEDAVPQPPLAWDPVRPLLGTAPWWERICWTSPEMDVSLEPWFTRTTGAWRIPSKHLETSDRRNALVSALLEWAQAARSVTPRADVALVRLLQREQVLLEAQCSSLVTDAKIDKSLGELKRKLFHYQEEGVRRFLDRGRLLLGDDMGLGKTAQAIASSHVLFRTQQVRRGLVIVPAALKPQWAREWSLFTSVPATVVDGTPEDRRRQYRALKSGFLFINYEQVLKDLPELLRLAPEMVILDEAQRIKNWAAKTSVYVKQLQPAWRLVLSGTPLENRLTELASLMDWVDDLALEPKWRLDAWHAVRSDGTRELIGARHLSTLRARLEHSSLRRVRQEVLKQLPPRTDTRVPVALTPEQDAAHADLDRPIARLIATSSRRPLTQPEFLQLMSLLTRQRIICNGLAQRDFEELWPQLEARKPTDAALSGLFTPKLAELRDLLTNLVVTQGRKVVVFSQWKRMLRLAEWATRDVLADAGARAAYFTGDESQKRRTQNVVDFHDDPKTCVLFATDAGGVGLNLQRAASACVHLDLPWNPAVLEQRSGRIYRLGQANPVEIYALVSSGGLESRIATLVGDKKALFDGLFDGTSDGVSFEKGGSFLATVQRMVEPVILPDPSEAAEDSEVPETGDVEDTVPTVAELKPSVAPAVPVLPSEVTQLMANVRMERLEDGRMRIDAPPEAAASMAAMFEGLAALFRQAAGK